MSQLCRSTLGIIAALALATPALAHEAGGHNRGTVERITATELALMTSDGHPVVYKVSPETRFERGGAAIKPSDVKVGERAVVEGAGHGANLTASKVRLAPNGHEHDHGQIHGEPHH